YPQKAITSQPKTQDPLLKLSLRPKAGEHGSKEAGAYEQPAHHGGGAPPPPDRPLDPLPVQLPIASSDHESPERPPRGSLRGGRPANNNDPQHHHRQDANGYR